MTCYRFMLKAIILNVFLILQFVELSGQVVLQRCDIANLWTGSNTITVDANEKQEGIASIRFTGSGQEWFKKQFSQTDAGIDESGWFIFWLFVSDVTRFNGEGQIELSSSGGPDADEYSWNISDIELENGWNEIKLRIADANIVGSPSLKAINFFRIYQHLSGNFTARLDYLHFVEDIVGQPERDPLDIPIVDSSTLDGKVMFGYQGWFNAPGDGSQFNRWRHWGSLQNENSIDVEMFPDMREYEPDEKYATGLTYADGRIARVYSSYNKKTVMRHMKWLRDYNLDGVFLQRFNVTVRDNLLKRVQDTVTVNIMAGCERYGRVFVNMWDLSGVSAGCADELIADWKHMVDNLKITESPNYLHHRGKPLVAIWGFTVRDELPREDLAKMIDFFKNSPDERYRANIMLGTNHDFFNRVQWVDLLRQVDVISPWAVGRFGNANSNVSFINNYVRPGQDWCDRNNVDFLPVIWPGFSWYNLKREGTWQQNQIRRDGGNFFWAQANRVVSSNAKMVYIAMYDEVDEATAMFKVAENAEQSPAMGYWLPLDADGYQLPSDWYLRSAQLASQVVKGITPNRTTLGTPPEGIDIYRVIAQHTKCGTTDGSFTFNYPEVQADDFLAFSIDNGQTYPYETLAGSANLDTEALASGSYNIWMCRADGSFPTDLGTYSILDLEPDASVQTTDATCGHDDGLLTIAVGDNPYMGPLQISIDGGQTYELTTTDGIWSYKIDNLSPGSYSIWCRWEDSNCIRQLSTVTIGTQSVPITLLPVSNGSPLNMDGLIVRTCKGDALTISAEPTDDDMTWAWSGVNAFSASTPNVLISDSVTTSIFGRYEVSYTNNQNGCNNRLTFFIREETNCPTVDTKNLPSSYEISVFPNPTSGIVRFETNGIRIKALGIVDGLGRHVALEVGMDVDFYTADLSAYVPGIYFYFIESTDGQHLYGKIVKE